jgi:DNA-binding PadR family transcriptional regulator
MLEDVMLGLLMTRTLNGYQMKQMMDISTSNFMGASYGSIYPALRRLEEKGFIAGREEVANGKYTKEFSLTETGRERFLRWLRIPANLAGGSHEHLEKLFFCDYLTQTECERHFTSYIEQAKTEAEQLCATQDIARESSGPNRMATLTYGIAYYNAIEEFYSRLLYSSSVQLAAM